MTDLSYVVRTKNDLLAEVLHHHLEATRGMKGITVESDWVTVPITDANVKWQINEVAKVAITGGYAQPVEVAKASAAFVRVWNPTGMPRQVVEL